MPMVWGVGSLYYGLPKRLKISDKSAAKPSPSPRQGLPPPPRQAPPPARSALVGRANVISKKEGAPSSIVVTDTVVLNSKTLLCTI